MTSTLSFRMLLVLAVLLLVAPVCVADVVHLRTGEAIKGRPLPAESDEKVLAIEDFLSGSTRRLRWIGHFATAGVVVIAVSMWVLQDGGDLSAPGDGTLRLEPAADAGPPAELHSRRVILETAPPPQARM